LLAAEFHRNIQLKESLDRLTSKAQDLAKLLQDQSIMADLLQQTMQPAYKQRSQAEQTEGFKQLSAWASLEWQHLSKHLLEEHPEQHVQLRVQAATGQYRSDYLWQGWLMGKAAEKLGLPGRHATDVARSAEVNIWKLRREERLRLASQWRADLRAAWAQQLSDLLQKIERDQLARRELQDRGKVEVLRKARVIGCTTTGAAVIKDTLQGSVKPGRRVQQTSARHLVCGRTAA
jgi:hypothetical protein